MDAGAAVVEPIGLRSVMFRKLNDLFSRRVNRWRASSVMPCMSLRF
jgi:hypothetical protein